MQAFHLLKLCLSHAVTITLCMNKDSTAHWVWRKSIQLANPVMVKHLISPEWLEEMNMILMTHQIPR